MLYVTDQEAATLGLPSDAALAAQVLADSQTLYDYVQAHPYVTDSQLAVAAEGVWGAQGPDRLAAAIRTLEASKRLFAINETAKKLLPPA